MPIMKKFLVLVLVACVCVEGVKASVNGLSDPYSWFNETYANFTVVRSNKWTTAAGAWRTYSPQDRSVFSNATKTVYVDTHGGEIRLQPNAQSAKNGNSARANDLRWNNRVGFWGDANEPGDVEMLREFLKRRFAWFDKKFATAGAASTNLTATVSSSGLRYAREGVLRPTFDGATPNPNTVETDVVDVSAPLARAPLTATVAVPGTTTTKLVVYVNGISNGTYAVSAEKATISIPAQMLRMGETNVVAFIARRADGTIRRRNFALVACTLPVRLAAEDGGHGVDISWLADAWSAFRAAQPDTGLAAPVSYDDYLAFATNASPYGKSVPLYYDYVTGTRPEETDELFRADIVMDDAGKPQISWHPDTPALRATRAYTLWGAQKLSGPWASTDAQNPVADFCETNRFFKVGVALPSAQ